MQAPGCALNCSSTLVLCLCVHQVVWASVAVSKGCSLNCAGLRCIELSCAWEMCARMLSMTDSIPLICLCSHRKLAVPVLAQFCKLGVQFAGLAGEHTLEITVLHMHQHILMDACASYGRIFACQLLYFVLHVCGSSVLQEI